MSNYKTVSELLRECAEADFPLTAIEKKLGCSGVTLGETVNLLADEIDAEKREITERYARQSWMNPADAIAKLATGEIEWSELKETIDRYYLPRPLSDDGEPVQFGDRFVNDSGRNATLSSLNYTKGDHDYVSANGEKKHKVTSRLKCPEPQVLDADDCYIISDFEGEMVPNFCPMCGRDLRGDAS